MDDRDVDSIVGTEPDEALEARRDAEARADFAAGRVISHRRISEWLTKRAKGEKIPLPSDD